MTHANHIVIAKKARAELADLLMPRLQKAFRAGLTGRPFQHGLPDITNSCYAAYLAGHDLKRGKKHNAMVCWQNARFVAGSRTDLDQQGLAVPTHNGGWHRKG